MITTQIIQCIDQELSTLNNSGFIAGILNRNARFELNLVRKTVINFKKLEELKAQVEEPVKPSEDELMRDTAIKENAIILQCIRDIRKYYTTKNGEVLPAYLEAIIGQCEKDVEHERTDFYQKRLELFSKRLAEVQKKVTEL
ncbi:MAG: hypothetical protein IKG25_01225 [Mogibacterium sp.]|nr:hypothetical protein [Bacteroidaceae bacterium]MBR3329824.1 hypothetical protein [Mogibacterium sp.]